MTAMILWATNSMVYDITPWTLKKSSIFKLVIDCTVSPSSESLHGTAIDFFGHLQSKTFDHFVA